MSYSKQFSIVITMIVLFSAVSCGNDKNHIDEAINGLVESGKVREVSDTLYLSTEFELASMPGDTRPYDSRHSSAESLTAEERANSVTWRLWNIVDPIPPNTHYSEDEWKNTTVLINIICREDNDSAKVSERNLLDRAGFQDVETNDFDETFLRKSLDDYYFWVGHVSKVDVTGEVVEATKSKIIIVVDIPNSDCIEMENKTNVNALDMEVDIAPDAYKPLNEVPMDIGLLMLRSTQDTVPSRTLKFNDGRVEITFKIVRGVVVTLDTLLARRSISPDDPRRDEKMEMLNKIADYFHEISTLSFYPEYISNASNEGVANLIGDPRFSTMTLTSNASGIFMAVKYEYSGSYSPGDEPDIVEFCPFIVPVIGNN